MSIGADTRSVLAVLALCLALALGGQALADRSVSVSGTDTNEAVGRAALSYASGLRTYAAAVLWNRIDPLIHNYYSTTALEDQRYMMSTIAVVEALDPQFVQPYYVGAWILARNGKVSEGLDMARRGVEENPDSGVLLTGYAQLLELYGDDVPLATEMAERALDPGVVWTDVVEKHNSYPILGAVLRAGGRDDLDAIVQAELERLDALAGDELPADAHDHDHDGEPDH